MGGQCAQEERAVVLCWQFNRLLALILRHLQILHRHVYFIFLAHAQQQQQSLTHARTHNDRTTRRASTAGLFRKMADAKVASATNTQMQNSTKLTSYVVSCSHLLCGNVQKF